MQDTCGSATCQGFFVLLLAFMSWGLTCLSMRGPIARLYGAPDMIAVGYFRLIDLVAGSSKMAGVVCFGFLAFAI